jgi:Cellulase (glycosyl hydrolase family 5)
MQPYSIFKILLMWFFCVAQGQALDKVSLVKGTSLFTATEKTVPIVSAKYIGWEANWKWAGARIKPDAPLRKDASAPMSYTGEVKTLDMDFTSATSVGKGQITWVYNWNKKADHPKALGFGIEFNLKMDSPSFATPPQAPELLPGNQGWRWQTPDGQSIEVKFSPALAKLYFERNQVNTIRALFLSAIDKGSQKSTMTVSVSKNVALATSISADYGENDTQSWHRDILPEKTSPVDLSFMNSNDLPAGKHGFVKAQADHLVFEDGTPVKFWGANLMASALFSTSDIDIKTHAKRIAQLGFNLIRIHHHDSLWVNPNIFKDPTNDTQELSSDSLKKLDWWIKCLKDQGVYIWLDLHVGRTFTKNWTRAKDVLKLKGLIITMKVFKNRCKNSMNPI